MMPLRPTVSSTLEVGPSCSLRMAILTRSMMMSHEKSYAHMRRTSIGSSCSTMKPLPKSRMALMKTCETTADMKRRWCGLERKEKPMVRALKMRIALELEICRGRV